MIIFPLILSYWPWFSKTKESAVAVKKVKKVKNITVNTQKKLTTEDVIKIKRMFNIY